MDLRWESHTVENKGRRRRRADGKEEEEWRQEGGSGQKRRMGGGGRSGGSRTLSQRPLLPMPFPYLAIRIAAGDATPERENTHISEKGSIQTRWKGKKRKEGEGEEEEDYPRRVLGRWREGGGGFQKDSLLSSLIPSPDSLFSTN